MVGWVVRGIKSEHKKWEKGLEKLWRTNKLKIILRTYKIFVYIYICGLSSYLIFFYFKRLLCFFLLISVFNHGIKFRHFNTIEILTRAYLKFPK